VGGADGKCWLGYVYKEEGEQGQLGGLGVPFSRSFMDLQVVLLSEAGSGWVGKWVQV